MIQVGIIGLGRITDVHFPAYANSTRARIYGVCDTNGDLAEQRKKEWHATVAYTDYRDLLADPKIDAVEIITPHGLHDQMVCDAAAAGKHIAVQKPMTISLKSATRMIEAARKHTVLLKVTDNYAFYPPIVMAKKLIDDGAIGEVTNITIHFVGGGKGGWEVPASAWEWRIRENEEGGGTRGLQTFDHGHHLWTTAWYLLGDVDRTSAWIDSVDGIVDSPSVVMWKHKDGKAYGMCEFFHGTDLAIPSKYYANDEWIQVGGSKGILFIRRCTGLVHEGPAVSLFTDEGWQHFDDIPSDWGDGFIGAAENFFRAIEGEEAPLLSGEDGREVLRFCLAVQKSSQVRREVYLDELDTRFPDRYARRRRKREMRESSGKKSLLSRIMGEGTARYAPRAREATLSLFKDFDGNRAGDWCCDFGLDIMADGNTPAMQFAVSVKDGTIEYTEGMLPDAPVFVIKAAAGVWAAVLIKQKRIETAFIRGKITIDGKAEEALKLRSVFGL